MSSRTENYEMQKQPKRGPATEIWVSNYSGDLLCTIPADEVLAFCAALLKEAELYDFDAENIERALDAYAESDDPGGF